MTDKIQKFHAECQCGNVKLTSREMPSSITSCNCSMCYRIGALWAYFDADKVVIQCADKPINTYLWGEKTLTYHYCGECGCSIHYTTTDPEGNEIIAINSRMAPASMIGDIPLRKFDGLLTWKYLDE